MGGWLDEPSFETATDRQQQRLSAPMRLWLDMRSSAPSPRTEPAPLSPSRVTPVHAPVSAVRLAASSVPSSVPSLPRSRLVASLTECRGGCRPLLDELAAKCGWLSAQQTAAAAAAEADVLFTDIKRAGKKRCFKLVEEGRQLRLSSLRGLGSSVLPLRPLARPCPRVNCFPGMAEAVSKCSLSRCLSFHQRLFPSEYDYFPVTYDLSTAGGLSDACSYLSLSAGSRALIVKPSRGSQGAGIELVQHAQQLQSVLYGSPNKRFIAQHYIASPSLLGGFKWDMRVYVLVSSLSPLTLHVFHDGLARVCTEPYRRPSALNLSHTLSHLSNYSLNKHSLAFKPPTEDQATQPAAATAAAAARPSSAAAPFSPCASIDLDDEASKRSIRAALSQLAHQGTPVDERRFWADVNEIAEKTVLALTPTLWSAYSATFPSAADEATLGSGCFHLLGFDCLLDDKHALHLLEVNSAPSMATDSALDWRVKMSVWQKSMHIMGLLHSTVAATPPSADDDEPQSSRSVSSVSSVASSASSCASVQSRRSSIARSTTSRLQSASASAARPHSHTSSARVLRSHSLRRPSSAHCAAGVPHIASSSIVSQRPPLPFDIPAFDWRDMRHTTATAATSACPHLHRALCHPRLLCLYHQHAQPNGGLTAATFRRLVALFTSSAPWCTPLPAGDTHLLFLQQTRLRGQSVLSFDGVCACLAAIRRRYVHGGVGTDRQEAAVWEQWSSDAYQRFATSCFSKAPLSGEMNKTPSEAALLGTTSARRSK